VAFLDEPTTGLDPRSRQSIWQLIARFKAAGITTLLTTQYLEEADALSDRIIMIDGGSIIAEGTVDELKRLTGSGYCEIVPQDPADLPAIATVLASMLPEGDGSALSVSVDRITIPAPDGANTLVEAIRLIDHAGIALTDVGLRRPSLDDVFFTLTADPAS
jgi:ABC-2 type transport system ATP-binding protein